jgi:elongation factor 1-beta
MDFEYATPAGLGKINGFLAEKSYVSGFQPSSEDARVFAELEKNYGNGVDKKFPHVYRFYTHIKSFTPEERANWPAPSAQPSTSGSTSAAAEKPAKTEEAGDEEFDMFSEMSETEKQAEDARKDDTKKAKVVPIGRSNIILDVKVLDDSIDLAKVEELVRGIQIEGCTWGPSKLVAVAFGIKKLQISCVVIDDLVSTDDLEEKITAFEDLVQSVDIAAFVKV